MAISRKGKQAKYESIQRAITRFRPATVREVYMLLDDMKLNLTNSEAFEIVRQWEDEQIILARHGKGVLEMVI